MEPNSQYSYTDAQNYFDTQAHFNKWLNQLTTDEKKMIVEMLNEFNLQQNDINCLSLLREILNKEQKLNQQSEDPEIVAYTSYNIYSLCTVIELIQTYKCEAH